MILSLRLCDAILQRLLEDTARRLGCEPRPLRSLHDVGADPGVGIALLDAGLEELGDYVAAFRSRVPSARVVVVTGRSDARALVEALELGADEVLRKPMEMEDLRALLCAGQPPRASMLGMESAEPGMQDALQTLARAAASGLAISIHGEAGSGRLHLARAVHEHSGRRRAPCVELSSLEIDEALGRGGPPALREAMPGHDPATLLSRARGGSLVLVDVDEISSAAQEALLLCLEEGAREAGGEGTPRILAISTRPLGELAAEGRLDEDLARMLSVVSVRVPSLRERPADVATLARDLLAGFAERDGRSQARLDAAAESALRARRWKGNVRELENLMERAALLFPGREVDLDHIEAGIESPARAVAPELNLKKLERAAIERSLTLTRGSRTEAAKVLGISVRTLRNKIRRYELA